MIHNGSFENTAFVRRARRHLSAADDRMAAIMKAVGPFKPGVVNDIFQALALSIIHQQLSMKAARTIGGRVQALCRGKRLSPAALSAASESDLRQAGLSRQKVVYMRSICEHFLDGRINPRQLKTMNDEQVIERLIDIKGVGVWTAEMILMFSLQRPDVWPVDDLGLRTALARWYRVPKSAKRTRLVRAGEKYRPYRSVATWYLWSSLNTGVVPGFD